MSSLHATLSLSIEKETTKLLHLISNFSHPDFRIKQYEGTGGLVSTSDILAYQIEWAKLLLEWYNNGINNKTFIMPGEGFTKWDYTAIAIHFYKKYESYSYEKLVETFSTLVTQIISVVEKEYKSGNLEKLGV